MSAADQTWPFLDPPNTAVFSDARVSDGEEWIQRATHDVEDGAWQFLPPGGASMQNVIVVSLRSVVALDPSLAELADLPLGWQAWRDQPTGQWNRAPKSK